MKLDPTRPVQTRDGRKARIVSDKIGIHPLKYIAVVTNEDGKEYAMPFSYEGRVYNDAKSIGDLVNVPEKREMWVNVYEGEPCVFSYASRNYADMNSHPNRIACVHVEYEVGEGL